MVKTKSCCVSGCKQTTDAEETEFHKFPINKLLKKKWLAAFKTAHTVNLSSVVCSEHFTDQDYKMVRGRRLLKVTAVPSVFDESHSKDDDDDSLPLKAAAVPFIDVRTSDMSTKEPFIMDGTPMDFEETIPEAKITKKLIENGPVDRASLEGDEQYFDENEKNCSTKDTVTEQNRENKHKETTEKETDVQTDKTNSISEDSNKQDANTVGDSNQFRDSNGIGDTNKEMEESVECVPDFIEIAVKNSRGECGSPDDCLMVLENVQVDVDPALLLQLGPPGPDPEPATVDLGDSDPEEDRPAGEPVSLLTSSDESDVILEEPHIDTVEVSDETDEDDRPLTRLLPRAAPPAAAPPAAAEHKKKKSKISRILWGKLGELYCYRCPFTTSSSIKLKQHNAEHDNKNTELFTCNNCIFTTASKTQFQKHKRTHKTDKRYSCNMCSYRARHHMSLAYHMKSHSEKYKCNQCDYRSAQAKELQAHLKTHRQVRVKNGKKRFTRLKKDEDSSDTSDEEYRPEEEKRSRKRRS